MGVLVVGRDIEEAGHHGDAAVLDVCRKLEELRVV